MRTGETCQKRIVGAEIVLMNKLYVMDVSFLEDPEEFEYWYEKMKPQRRKKIDAIKPEASKRLSLGAGILLDRALREIGITEYELVERGSGKPYLACVTECVTDEASAGGKPYLSDVTGHPCDIFFNLSHSGTKVALGISDKEIGVDIEKIRHFKDSLIKRVFTEEERQLAQRSSWSSGSNSSASDGACAEPDEAYTALWTRKESYMKYTGRGLSLLGKENGSSPMSLPGKENGSSPMSLPGKEYDSGPLHFTIYEPEGYKMCVCSEYEEFEYHEE